MRRILILMAKHPMPQHTKTRLFPVLNPEQAAELYACFLHDKIKVMRCVPNCAYAIAYTPADGRSYFETLAPDFFLYLQNGLTLSERLQQVVRSAFQEGYQQVMPIDGDSVTLPPDYLVQGFEALENPDVDIVLGPSDDGGYYGIGLKGPHDCIFDVQMSTPQVIRDTLEQAKKHNLAVHLLPEWYDIDTPDDLKRLQQEIAKNPTSAPYTANYLRGLS